MNIGQAQAKGTAAVGKQATNCNVAMQRRLQIAAGLTQSDEQYSGLLAQVATI